MTALPNRPATALLVIDVQHDVVAAAHQRDRVVATIAKLVQRARVESAPVIWVQHDDADLTAETDGWQIVTELVPGPEEPIVRKQHRDAFESTTLEHELAAHNVGRLVVTGAQTDFCVRWTLHGALTRGYETVLVADGHTTDELSPAGWPSGAELIAHTNAIWQTQSHPDVAASVVEASTVTFG